MKLNKTILIGIAGGSASGKTTIAYKLKNMFDKKVNIIREDDYYKDRSEISFEERKSLNYDHPCAFDHDLLKTQLLDLVNGKSIKKPIYDFTIHNRSDKTELVNPSDVIIIEGLFVLEDKDIRDLLDIKIFVDTPSDIRFIRRLLRDIKERKRDLDNVIEQYQNTVRVMHDEFIEPSKKFAHIIIPEGGNNDVAIDLIANKIKSIVDINLSK